MEIHGLVLLAFGTFLVAGSNDFRSDYEFHSAANGWFKFQKIPAKWHDARLRCNLEGAVLASPINVDVSDVIHSIISGHKRVFSSGVYTGIHNTITPTEYTSVEGVPLYSMPVGMYENMFPEDYSGTSSCMRLLPEVGLVAGSCTDALPYICYKKKTKELVITECGTIDTGYRLDNRIGHCYKYHRYSQPWAGAYLTCAAEGGHLAIINSAAEAQVIRELIASVPNEAIFGGSKGGTALGYDDWNEKGIWRTIHGQTLVEAGYEDWSPGQPDNSLASGSEGQHCGRIFRGGSRQFDDIQCRLQESFICEKDPASLRPIPQISNTQY
ncbi:C-type mannose receptor 2 [Manduca sexta]|uniref:C-type lectin domain-containing protein n=1 Tax=Manduca sexta TaxID=7130 RepID=A0A921YNM0_MANSE|nr:C-type mannose receptor 2 [Manduca sexta]KAG6442319.1 hypothetical protein O3G_MSEX002273 [Manduca sexta]